MPVFPKRWPMKDIRICYISRIYFSSTRTHVYNIARTCEALNNRGGISVRLVSTDAAPDVDVFFNTHGVVRPFPITGLGATSTPVLGRLQFFVALFRANSALVWFLVKNRASYDVVYARDEGLLPAAFAARLLGKPFFFESHSVLIGRHRQFLNTSMVRLSRGLVAISKQLQNYYAPLQKNSIVSYCGSEETFWVDTTQTQHQIRERLKLPGDKFLVGYAGVLGANPNGDVYELDDVIRALAMLPKDVFFIAVGEQEHNADWLRRIAVEAGVADRIIIIPWQKRSITPQYLQSFDVVVIPKRKKDMESDSPLKMFSAMSVGRPIVGGKTLAITEVLTHGQNALIVSVNTPEGWAEALEQLHSDGALAKRIAQQACEDAKKYTWERRGVDIGEFIQRNA